jgi:antitoxin component of RelBE/YafQ-DinJ toxin-antitoxin module
MSTTITIRADESLRKALADKAVASGMTLSQLIRQILEQALEERPLSYRAGQLKGRLQLAQRKPESWRQQLRDRNWRS